MMTVTVENKIYYYYYVHLSCLDPLKGKKKVCVVGWCVGFVVQNQKCGVPHLDLPWAIIKIIIK